MLKKKVIWTFHNLEPHRNIANVQSKELMGILKKRADLIIHHTAESMCFTNMRKSFYFFHPFEVPNMFTQLNDNSENKYDILIWGAISPYKGIAEFLEFMKTHEQYSKLRIMIAGKTNDNNYKERLERSLTGYVKFINRFHSDEELAILHLQSHYVFFSHQGVSVLNSGQLVVSLGYGSNIIGPNKGAFKELGKKELICTYEKFEEVVDIIQSGKITDKKRQKAFVLKHSWGNFADALVQRMETI